MNHMNKIMKEYVIDTSVFISLLIDKEPHHASAISLWDDFEGQLKPVLLFPRIVVIELMNKYYQITHEALSMNAIQEMIHSMGGAFQMDMDEELHDLASQLIPELSLKTSDLIIVAHAKLAQATLLTWDKRMIREASKIVKVMTPEELLNISS